MSANSCLRVLVLFASTFAMSCSESGEGARADANGVGGSAGSSARPSATMGGTTSVGGAETSAAGATGAATGPSCAKDGDDETTLQFVNRCAATVVFRGSDDVSGTLPPDTAACIDIGTATEALSSKRYWGWIGADPGAERHTLAEFTFNTDFYDMDWYNISHVDAHNLPMAILPIARPSCRQLRCPQDFIASCPAVGQYRNSAGEIRSCVSPERDNPKSAVALLFERCDDAYAWSGDDQIGADMSPMVGCEVEDFEVVFCPEAE